MSTAVYLAASLYLHRLCAIENVIPCTPLTVHRLVLAAVRVAAKSLEDLTHSHARFAKVGGLPEGELQRLEISFCFLMDFELKVNREQLEPHVQYLKDAIESQASLGNSPAL